MISRGVTAALAAILYMGGSGCAAFAPAKPYSHAEARQRVLAIKGCPEKYIAHENPKEQRFWLVGCGLAVPVRVVCDAEDCVPKREPNVFQVAMPARLKTSDGIVWVDPAPSPPATVSLEVKQDGQPALIPAGRVTAGRLLSDLRSPRHKPTLPEGLNRPGMVVWGLYKVCVTSAGDVQSVKIIKPGDPAVDSSWIAKIETWKYAPYAIDGKPVPFCKPVRLEVRAV